MMSSKRSEVPVYAAIYVVLLVLLALTVEAARHDLGELNLVITLSIAAAKAILIVLFFMHVRHSTSLVKLVIAAALLWLAILFALAFADYATRPWDLIIGGMGNNSA